jgi:5-methylcytosine-specific restriction endonuclease McrBC regulatory subunit McrC
MINIHGIEDQQILSSWKILHRRYGKEDMSQDFHDRLDWIRNLYQNLMSQLIDQKLRSHYLIQDHNLCYIKTIIRINRMVSFSLLRFVGILVSVDFHPFIIDSFLRRIICTWNLEIELEKEKKIWWRCIPFWMLQR